jgi:hypothetical protein
MIGKLDHVSLSEIWLHEACGIMETLERNVGGVCNELWPPFARRTPLKLVDGRPA